MASLSTKRASVGRSEMGTTLEESFGILRVHPFKNNIQHNSKKSTAMKDLCFNMAHISPKFKNIVYSIPYMSKRLIVM